MVTKDHAVQYSLPRDAQSVRRARHIVSTLLTNSDSGVLLDTALLLVSELVGNAVRYGEEPIMLDVRRDDGDLVVGVSDAGSAQPAMAPAAPAVVHAHRPSRIHDIDPQEPVGGRGLHLVQTLSDDWGIERRDGDKRVWFVLRAGT